MPVFNGERYLAQALAGIRSQTLPDFEVVIADNASTDGTEKIAAEAVAEDGRFRYVRREQNIGLVPNFNRLVTETDAEFFAWHSSDDVAEPEYYATCVRLLRAHPEAAAAVTSIRLIDEAGNRLRAAPEHIRSEHPDLAVRFAELASLRHFCQFTYGVFRRSMLEKTRLMIPFFWSSDRVLLAEVALQGRMVRDPQQLYLVRQHAHRATRGGRAAYYANLASPRRGTVLRYARELRLGIDHAQLEPGTRSRVHRARRRWALANSLRLARSAVGAALGAGTRAVLRRDPQASR